MRYDTVTLLSDLGTDDEAAGVVRAVLHDLAPGVRVIDLTHGVAPFDVRAGALALARAIPYVPAGVVIAAVDPGAGSSRMVAVEVAGGRGVLLGPDNGLLAPAVAVVGGGERAVVLDDQSFHLSGPGGGPTTFAMRDVLAPVAAELCNGAALDTLGTTVDPADLLPGVVPLPHEEPGAEGRVLVGEVLSVDRFGNCELNISPDDVRDAFGTLVGDRLQISFAGNVRSVLVVAGYDAIAAGSLALVADAAGMLAVAASRGSAAAEGPLGIGDQVVVGPARDDATGATTTAVHLRQGRSAPVSSPACAPRSP